MIEVSALSKRFGKKVAVDALTFSAKPGEVLGFLGPNGAGKSTTMKMITGFLKPSSGSAKVMGIDVGENPLAAQRCFGYLPESAASYGEMLVSEFLSFMAEIRGLKGRAAVDALERVREKVFIQDVWHQPIETLSKGFRQRVGFAQALIHDPEVLILDEPTDGLDPNQKHEVRKLIQGMSQSKTIVLSTHILEEVEMLCNRVVIVSQGRLVVDEPLEELLNRDPNRRLDVVFRSLTTTVE